MIAEAQQAALQKYMATKHTEWARTLRVVGHQWDVESLAADLVADARFAQVQLCGMWYGPTETEIRDVLSPVLTYTGYGPDLALVSAAVALACHRRRINANPVVAFAELIAQIAAKAKG